MPITLTAQAVLANLHKAEKTNFELTLNEQGELDRAEDPGVDTGHPETASGMGASAQGNLSGRAVRTALREQDMDAMLQKLKNSRESSAYNAGLALLNAGLGATPLNAGAREEIKTGLLGRVTEALQSTGSIAEEMSRLHEILRQEIIARQGEQVDLAPQDGAEEIAAEDAEPEQEQTWPEYFDGCWDEYAQASQALISGAQTPGEIMETAGLLNASLDEVEEEVKQGLDILAGAVLDSLPGTVSEQTATEYLQSDETMSIGVAGLKKIHEERALIDALSRSLVAREAGNEAGDAAPVTWQQAIEFKRAGMNVGNNVKLMSHQHIRHVIRSVPDDERPIIRFDHGGIRIFCPLDRGCRDVSLVPIAEHAGIASEQPRYGAREVASSNLDKLLDFGLLLDTGFFMLEGKLGTLTELPGGSPGGGSLADTTAAHEFSKNPSLCRDITNLQVLDAVTGEHARTLDMIGYMADASGKYEGIKGLDSSLSFGSDPDYNDLSRFGQAGSPDGTHHAEGTDKYAASYNTGLPPVIDAQTAARILAPDFPDNAKASVAGLVRPDEMDRMTERIEQVRHWANDLVERGSTVSDWNSGKTDNSEQVLRLFTEHPRRSYYLDYLNFSGVSIKRRR